MTLHDQFVSALEKRGCKRVNGRTQKYTQLTREKGGFYFVGRSGALRVGKVSTRSIPVSDKFKQLLLEEVTNGST